MDQMENQVCVSRTVLKRYQSFQQFFVKNWKKNIEKEKKMENLSKIQITI